MISIWSVPDLHPIMETFTEIPKDLLLGLRFSADAVFSAPVLVDDDVPDVAAPGALGDAAAPTATVSKARPMYGTCRLSELTALRRPLSRWAGSQGSSRSAKAPRGTLFVAAVLADPCEAAVVGAGVLMEWALSPGGQQGAACQSAQVAHDSPIVSIAFGPYDNGPVITADRRGVFRVWDCCPRRGSRFKANRKIS